MNRRYPNLICMLALSCLAAGACGETTENLLAGFEDGTAQSWTANDATTIAVSDEHPSQGAKSLRADLSPGGYPGITLQFKPQDWSTAHALRLSIFNAAQAALPLTVRIDDADSRNFGTRYNQDSFYKLAPGANDLEVTIVSLWQGTLLSRGLHVNQIASVHLFVSGLKQPGTLFFDNIRLVTEKPEGPDTLPLADFNKEPALWEASSGATLELAAPVADTAKALRLVLPAGQGGYPGVMFNAVPTSWLTYDQLCLDLACPKENPAPTSISIKLIDAAGHAQTLVTPLAPGANQLRLPLSLAGSVALGRLKSLVLFFSQPAMQQSVFLENISLRRARLVNGPTVHGAAPDARLTLDFTAFKGLLKNSAILATVWIPLKSGETRVVRCTSAGTSEAVYSVNAEAFAAQADDQPIRVWACFLDHGVWYWCAKEIKNADPIKVIFDDKSHFGH